MKYRREGRPTVPGATSTVTISIRIRILSLLTSLLLAIGTSSSLLAKPKVMGFSDEVPYKFQGDKLETLGYRLEIEWKGISEEDKKYIRANRAPDFYQSPGGKWILIELGIDRNVTNVWLYNKRTKEKPRLVVLSIFMGSQLYWYGDEVVEHQWTRMGFTTNTFLRTSANLEMAGLQNAIFYDTKSDIYLALHHDDSRDIVDGLLEVGRLFGRKGHKSGILEKLKLKPGEGEKLPVELISEVNFHKEALIITIDYSFGKPEYIKFYPKFLKGEK